jgi:hypothetical protein
VLQPGTACSGDAHCGDDVQTAMDACETAFLKDGVCDGDCFSCTDPNDATTQICMAQVESACVFEGSVLQPGKTCPGRPTNQECSADVQAKMDACEQTFITDVTCADDCFSCTDSNDLTKQICIAQVHSQCMFEGSLLQTGKTCPGDASKECSADVQAKMDACEMSFIDDAECGGDCFSCTDPNDLAKQICMAQVDSACIFEGSVVRPGKKCPGGDDTNQECSPAVQAKMDICEKSFIDDGECADDCFTCTDPNDLSKQICIAQVVTPCVFEGSVLKPGETCPGDSTKQECSADVQAEMDACEKSFIDDGECGVDCFSCTDPNDLTKQICMAQVDISCVFEGSVLKPGNTCPDGNASQECSADVQANMDACEKTFIDSDTCADDCFACTDGKGVKVCMAQVDSACVFEGSMLKPGKACPADAANQECSADVHAKMDACEKAFIDNGTCAVDCFSCTDPNDARMQICMAQVDTPCALEGSVLKPGKTCPDGGEQTNEECSGDVKTAIDGCMKRYSDDGTCDGEHCLSCTDPNDLKSQICFSQVASPCLYEGHLLQPGKTCPVVGDDKKKPPVCTGEDAARVDACEQSYLTSDECTGACHLCEQDPDPGAAAVPNEDFSKLCMSSVAVSAACTLEGETLSPQRKCPAKWSLDGGKKKKHKDRTLLLVVAILGGLIVVFFIVRYSGCCKTGKWVVHSCQSLLALPLLSTTHVHFC